MITLNLISPEYKKTIKIKRIVKDAQILFLCIMFIVIVAAIMLLNARRMLDDNFVETIGQTSLVSRNQIENKTNAQINQKIQLAQLVQQDYIPWSRFIIIFSKLIPDNVAIDSLIISPDTNQNEWKINLSGMAVSRNDFLNLKKNLLEAEDMFDEKDIEIPIDSLFEKENLKFNINLKIKKEVLVNLKMPDSY